ncbi:type III-B CRISPR module RAMP protein Cmr6 [Methylotuvimicrobium sp. KM2]|uniref:type III-B CRISPR module RAMP protein Cmr6 n=1 Tax=Methylotuvimicrobium sp. KM2 TaxID=3133976 RepID=UPI003100B341
MSTPLYACDEWPNQKPDQAHGGLWFDRFFNRYSPNWTLVDTAKKSWIDTVTNLTVTGNDEQLAETNARQLTLVSHLNGRSERYTSDWHFVSGMGNPHPVENGMSWHPTLAVPYLAGSAVKGLVRAWVESNEDGLSEQNQKARLRAWFGTEYKGDVAEQAGGLIFFDALPDRRPTLLCDIMTPHMGKWYSEGDQVCLNSPDKLPADWHEPVPIPFLAVRDIRLIFSIAPRQAALAEQLDAVFDALNNALEWLGAGAKTATGYGYLSLDSTYAEEKQAIQKKQARQAKQATLTEEQKEIEKLRQQFEDKQSKNITEAIGGPLYNDLKKLVEQTDAWPEAERAELLELAQSIVVYVNAKKSAKAKELLQRLRN